MGREKKSQNRVHKMNPNRPIVGNEYEYSESELAEMLRCKYDIIHFAENYFYIVTGDGRQKIKLFEKQRIILRSIMANKLNVVLSSRQNSKTTLMTIYCLHRAIFNDDKLLAYAANKESTAKEILGRIKMAYDELPVWLKSGVGQWSEKSVVFGNSSKILIAATAPDTFRGLTIDTLFLDEFAFVRPEVAHTFFNSVMPAISSMKKAKVIMVSTPNGAQGLFYELYNRGLLNRDNDPTEWISIRMHWTDFPGRGEDYKKQQLTIMNGDENRFAQEYDCQFLEIGTSAFNGKMISELKETLKYIQPKYSYDRCFKEYASFNRTRKYVAGIDVSGGIGADSHCIQILDITDLSRIEQVAVYNNNHLPVNVFAHIAMKILTEWGSPMTLIESNNQGAGFISFLKHVFKYENILNYKKNNRNEPAIFDLHDGVESNFHVKVSGIENFKYFFEHLKVLKINEIETVLELETFSKKENGGFGGKKRANDDRVMALVWALFILEKELAERYLKVVSWSENGKPTRIISDNSEYSFQNHVILHQNQSLLIYGTNDFGYKNHTNPYSQIAFI